MGNQEVKTAMYSFINGYTSEEELARYAKLLYKDVKIADVKGFRNNLHIDRI